MAKLIRVEKKGRIITTRNPREVLALSRTIATRIKPLTTKLELAGSIRRKLPPKDIDIVVIPKNKGAILNALKRQGKLISAGEQKASAMSKGVKIDVFFATPKNFGAQLLTYTGGYKNNIGLRMLAKRQGKLLNQYGLFDRRTNRLLASKTEQDIYRKLGKLKATPPEQRG